MHIIHGRRQGFPSEQRTANFTGTVWADPVLPTTDEVSINNVFFAPRSRTHWHSHDRGQILLVTSGEGLVYDRAGDGGVIRTGDSVFIPPDVEHWHGATSDTFLAHLAISLGGHDWLQPVTDEEYAVHADAKGRDQ